MTALLHHGQVAVHTGEHRAAGYAEAVSRRYAAANSNSPHARPALLNLPAGRDTAAGAAAEGTGI